MANILKVNTQELPTAFVDKISLNSVYTNNIISSTRVGLLISLKATKDADVGFFQNISTTNILTVNVLQVTDADLYSFLSLSKELVYYAVYLDKLSQMPIEILQIAYNRNLIVTKPTRDRVQVCIQELKQLFLDKTKINKKTISDFALTSVTSVVERLDSGEEVLNTYFRESFDITTDSGHLSYFIFSDYNDSLLRDQGVILENGTDVKVNCEVVINNSKLVSQTYTYTLPDGTLWTGYVHRDPASANQWKTGRLGDPANTKQTLIRNIYYNTKIQDFRTLSKLEKAPKRSDNVSEELLLKLLKVQFSPKKLSPIKFDGKLTNGIKVSLNVEKLLEKHSPLYSFISRLQLDNYNWIKNVSAYRKRVKRVNGLIVDFSKNEPVYLVNRNDIQVSSYQDGILQYRIRDTSLDRITNGSYCYGIKITFVDYILEKLELQLEKMLQNEIVSFLSKYQRESLMINSQTRMGNYNAELDMFTQNFIDTYKNNSLIASSIDVFIESFNMISAEQIENASNIKNNLVLQMMPNTANPDSIAAFVNLYTSLANSYERIIKTAKSSILQEEMFFSLDGQQVTKTQQISRPTPVSNNEIENSIIQGIKTMADKFSISFEKINSTNNKSTPVINNQQETLAQNSESTVLSIFDLVDRTAYLAKQIEAAAPQNVNEKPDTSVAVMQVKRESSNRLLEKSAAISNVKIPTPAKDVIFKETPKISRVITQEQPVQIQNISRAVAASPNAYTTTSNVSGDTLQEVVNKMLKARSRTLLNRRG